MQRLSNIERILRMLGWTNRDWNCHEVHVYKEYRPEKENGKVWEITVFCKVPVWEYDFVYYGQGDYLDYSPEQGGFIWNERLDYEFESIEDEHAVACVMDTQRREEFEWCMNNPFPLKQVYPHHWAVQKVEDRPNG